MPSWRQSVDKRLVNRDFARLWYGQAISNVGDFVFDTTLTLWVAVKLGAGKSWAPAAVSGLLLAAVIAIVFVGPIAGVWVDRWNRKRTMLGTEAVRAALAGIMALISLIPQRDLPIPVWLIVIFVIVFLLNAAGQFFNPARQVVIVQVVTGEEEQTRAFGISNATSAVAGMIGPPLAAPLLFTSGVTWALLTMLVAGWLASTSFRTFHARVLGVQVGPIDTIFTVAALLLVLGGVNAFITLPGSVREADAPDEPGAVAVVEPDLG